MLVQSYLLLTSIQGVHLQKEAVVIETPLILVMPISGITYRLRPM